MKATLLEFLPASVQRVLDLGTGDGRLLTLAKAACPSGEFVAIDFSPVMLEAARKRFAGGKNISLISHDFSMTLPDLGLFEAVISSFAIHHLMHDHLMHDRKRALYTEIFDLLLPGGVFCNLEHVASPTVRLHHQFLEKLSVQPEQEDPSNKLLEVETQLSWLREIGFTDVDCHWKWRELALLGGRKTDTTVS